MLCLAAAVVTHIDHNSGIEFIVIDATEEGAGWPIPGDIDARARNPAAVSDLDALTEAINATPWYRPACPNRDGWVMRAHRRPGRARNRPRGPVG